MKNNKKKSRVLQNDIGVTIGNNISANAQNASQASFDGMSLFRDKVYGKVVQNGQFEQAKGSLFEYIEAAKFNREAALKGSSLKAEVTDVYDSQAAADILIKDNGNIVREVQAKFSTTDNSAADSVFYQAGGQKGHWGKYKKMQRLIRKQDDYNENGSLLDEAKKLAKEKSEQQYHSEDYKDVSENLTDELHHEDVTSGGTTYEEVKAAYETPEKYIEDFKRQQYKNEVLTTTKSMAAAGFITSGVISGVFNIYQVAKGNESAKEAVANTVKDATKGAVRGAATGVVSSSIRISAVESGNKILSNSFASTAIAGGIIDGGVALYNYARGEIDSKQLRDELVATVAKSSTMIFLSDSLATLTGGAVNPFLSMAVYITLGTVVNCCKEIVCNARMSIEQSEKLIAIYNDALKKREEEYQELDKYLKDFTTEQRDKFDGFINSINENFDNGEKYDEAINAIVNLADYLNIELQHVNFDDFKKAMKNDVAFKLE